MDHHVTEIGNKIGPSTTYDLQYLLLAIRDRIGSSTYDDVQALLHKTCSAVLHGTSYGSC